MGLFTWWRAPAPPPPPRQTTVALSAALAAYRERSSSVERTAVASGINPLPPGAVPPPGRWRGDNRADAEWWQPRPAPATSGGPWRRAAAPTYPDSDDSRGSWAQGAGSLALLPPEVSEVSLAADEAAFRAQSFAGADEQHAGGHSVPVALAATCASTVRAAFLDFFAACSRPSARAPCVSAHDQEAHQRRRAIARAERDPDAPSSLLASAAEAVGG